MSRRRRGRNHLHRFIISIKVNEARVIVEISKVKYFDDTLESSITTNGQKYKYLPIFLL